MNKYSFFRAMYVYIAKPIFFQLDPEKIHDRMIRFGSFLSTHTFFRKLTKKLFYFYDVSLEQEIHGVRFKNPVGLSAGFDKDAHLIDILPSVGFGYEQVGTITLEAYEGNPGPRLKRFPKEKSLLVNFGLKSDGIDVVLNRIRSRKDVSFPLGLSIGKTNSEKTAAIAPGIADYAGAFRKAVESDLGSFYTINISCPNILQTNHFIEPGPLDELLLALFDENPQKPMFIKMPIHLPWPEFEKLIDVIRKYPVGGVVIGNLAKDRKKANIPQLTQRDRGNLSGMPTQEMSNELISQTYKKCGNSLVIIGAGGIFSAEDAYDKIKRGASLIQLVTGMVFNGPGVIGEINRDLVHYLKNDGYTSIADAVGANYKKNE